MNVPNLDTMNPEDLWSFWGKHQRGRAYRDLFPDGGKGSKKATDDLAAYASNKATATQCRQRGMIQEALMFESFCKRIYQRLPAFARW